MPQTDLTPPPALIRSLGLLASLDELHERERTELREQQKAQRTQIARDVSQRACAPPAVVTAAARRPR